jgi:phage tail-like protein
MVTVINNRSTIATDPIRNFRFLVTFLPHSVSTGSTNGNTNQGGPGGTGNGEFSTTWQNAQKATIGFTSVSGLAVQTDSIPYREGGYNTTVHQIPGQSSYAPISLARGVILGTSQNWQWMRELFQTVQSSTARTNATNFRCDLEIAVLSHPIGSSVATSVSNNGTVSNTELEDHVSLRFKVYNAWITALAYSDLNAGDNAIFVEQMTLVHEGFDIRWATDLTQSAADFTN